MHESESEADGTHHGLHPPWVWKGTETSRVIALSDGIFAFAMTLLVLSLALPAWATGGSLWQYLSGGGFRRTLFAYVITFFVIASWWQGHHLVFSYIRTYDQNLIRINTTFLLFIAILPFSTQVLNAAGVNPAGVVFFSGLQIAAGTTLGLLWVYASGWGRLVESELPADWVRYVRIRIFSTPAVFAASIPVAFYSTNYAELVWIALFATFLWTRSKKKKGA